MTIPSLQSQGLSTSSQAPWVPLPLELLLGDLYVASGTGMTYISRKPPKRKVCVQFTIASSLPHVSY